MNSWLQRSTYSVKLGKMCQRTQIQPEKIESEQNVVHYNIFFERNMPLKLNTKDMIHQIDFYINNKLIVTLKISSNEILYTLNKNKPNEYGEYDFGYSDKVYTWKDNYEISENVKDCAFICKAKNINNNTILLNDFDFFFSEQFMESCYTDYLVMCRNYVNKMFKQQEEKPEEEETMNRYYKKNGIMYYTLGRFKYIQPTKLIDV